MKLFVRRDVRNYIGADALVVGSDEAVFARIQGPMSMIVAGLLIEHLEGSEDDGKTRAASIALNHWAFK